jgi:hypothetical protein
MKITKRQLQRIIKEERAKILEEGMDSRPVDPQLVSNMDDAFFDFKRNLEGALGAVDRRWWENPAVFELIKEKMDELLGEYRW